MTRQFILLAVVAAALGLLAACGDVPRCTPGASASCACPDGRLGAQLCLSDGTFDACAAPCTCPDGRSGAQTCLPEGNYDDCRCLEDGALRYLELDANRLLADPLRRRIYATIPGGAAAHANTLVTIDSETASIDSIVAIGSDPNSLAISDDGTTLWVGIDGAFAIRRVDLTTSSPTPGTQYPLPTAGWDDLAAAGPMVVLPSTTDSVAISLHRFGWSTSFAGAVVIDDGVARELSSSGHTGASRLTGGPPGLLFGFNNLTTGFGFYVLTVTPEGLTQSEHRGLIGGFETDITYADGLVYATSGEVVDVRDPTTPLRAGKFAYSGAILPRPEQRRAIMLSGGSSPVTLRVLDVDTFTQVESVPLPDVPSLSVRNLVSPTPDTIAFSSADSGVGARRVYVYRSETIGSPP